MERYPISKKVPIPRRYFQKRPNKYPFHEMKVGDSIFDTSDKLVACAHAHGNYHNKKFCSRKENSGYRVWRTK